MIGTGIEKDTVWSFHHKVALHVVIVFLLNCGLSDDTVEFHVFQPQHSIGFSLGDTVTLHCFVTSEIPMGRVKWYVEFGNVRRRFYSDDPIEEYSDAHVSSLSRDQCVDHSIRIRNISSEYVGVYYCVKFQDGENEPYRSGYGTKLYLKENKLTLDTLFQFPNILILILLEKVFAIIVIFFSLVLYRNFNKQKWKSSLENRSVSNDNQDQPEVRRPTKNISVQPFKINKEDINKTRIMQKENKHKVSAAIVTCRTEEETL
ncbi:signal-regulatory protein beta-2 [Protopterus annectens]|uniref:signal-regulatory protein beta-2 n=1 Tax=Protopterus annectens TaxID=7888 RepID=UPI001CFC4043|nr:signal-regulatory protein beta-2 [Protopterus annectens]